MSTEIIMPQMGESIFEGTITKWLKAVGDTVAIDEPLFEISTDKVDAEIPSSVAGVLTEIRFPEGATVEVNTVVAVIGEAGSAVTPSNTARSLVQKSAPPQVAPPKAQVAAAAAGAPAVPALSVAAGRRIRSSPLARRIAKERGIELGNVAGTGSEGRITKDDVLHAASSPVAQSRVQKFATPQAPQLPPPGRRPLRRPRQSGQPRC